MTGPSSVASTTSDASRSGKPRRLGEVLIGRGVIDEDQLERALAIQKDRGGRLGERLLELGLVSPVDLVSALAEQFEFEFLDLDFAEIDSELVMRLPHALARRHRAVPIRRDDDAVVVAMANPADVIALDDVRSAVRMPIRPVMAEPGQILDVLTRLVQGDEQVEDAIRLAVADVTDLTDEEEADDESSDGPIVRFVDLMLSKAVAERASDIHIEPTMVGMRVRYRIDGVLHEVMRPPKSLHAGVVSRLKVLASIDIAEKRVPQDGRASIPVDDRLVDLRVATVPTVHGEAAVVRILRHGDGIVQIDDLELEESQLQRFRSAFRQSWGLILVTGPTGSGKTTSLYGVLRELNEPSRNILTVEDPVEYRLEGVKQVQVNPKAGLTFDGALRSLLRADPDVLLVGEIRDRETAMLAMEASLTGHLVLASVHTNSAAATPVRLIEMGVEPYLVVAGLRGVLAQRLARRLCDKCCRVQPLTAEEATAARIPQQMLREDGTFPARRAVGCPACARTGYRGRLPVNEFMVVSERMGQLILNRETSAAIARLGVAEGMIPMWAAGLVKVAQGQTTIEELIRCLS